MTTTRPPTRGTGRHAGSDGSFGRSVASAGGRGAVLVIVAVVIGILLMATSGDDEQAIRTDDELLEMEEAGVVDVTSPPTLGGGSTDSTSDPTASTTPGDSTPVTTPDGSTIPTTPPVQIDRSTIVVKVYNAAGIQGIAGSQTQELAALGYAPQDPGNADTRLATTRLYARPGFEASCEVVKNDLIAINSQVDLSALQVQTIDPANMPVQGYEAADCVVVVGQDFNVAR